MEKPVEDMTWEEIQAEREKIAAERAEIARRREGMAAQQEEPSFAEYARSLADGAEDDAVRELYEVIAEDQEAKAAAGAEDAEPAPWPHEHLVHCGLELDVRVPNQSALMAISMLQQLDGLATLQMEIFNTFLANHLSPQSLAKVIMEFTRPETEMTVESLIQALVNLRVEQANAS